MGSVRHITSPSLAIHPTLGRMVSVATQEDSRQMDERSRANRETTETAIRPETTNEARRMPPADVAETGANAAHAHEQHERQNTDRKSTRLNSSHTVISYAVFCL